MQGDVHLVFLKRLLIVAASLSIGIAFSFDCDNPNIFSISDPIFSMICVVPLEDLADDDDIVKIFVIFFFYLV